MYVDVPPDHDAVKVMVLPTFCVDGRVGFEVNVGIPSAATVFITDSANTPETTNSVKTGTLTVINAVSIVPLSISSITPPTPSIDNGQSVTITGTWSGGTAPYNAVWYTGPDGTTCPQEAANVLATYNGLTTTSNSITVSPTTTNSYCLGITDSESPPVTQLSLNYTENAITSGFYEPSGIAISPSGTYAYAVNYGNSNVVIIDTATNTVTNTITDPLPSGFDYPAAVAFSPSGTYAYVTNAGSNNVVIIRPRLLEQKCQRLWSLLLCLWLC